MFTTGGRGGKVIAVTNLNDNGPGSFRAALETQGPRTVVFRVAGTLKVNGDLNINHPDITIAGQSAPGDGICIAGTLNINTHNVIIRHLRVRRGVPTGGQGDDNIGGNPDHHIIIDHCSTSWGMDENISLYRHMRPSLDGSTQIKDAAEHITVQWTISSEALNARGHAFGGTWGGNPSTFHHNLFASNTARNPSIGMSGPFDFPRVRHTIAVAVNRYLGWIVCQVRITPNFRNIFNDTGCSHRFSSTHHLGYTCINSITFW